MATVTMVSDSQAKVGNRFYYIGPQLECRDCKLKAVCFNLEQGSLYEITAVRDQTHACPFNEDKVRAVEIEKRAKEAVAPKRSAMEGSIMTFQEIDCGRLDCVNYRSCHPPAMENGRKYSVVGIDGTLDCPIGENLVRIRLF